jgi:methionyl aminopeptidase
VPNVFEAASSEPLVEGLVLAVEPLLSLQPARVEEAPDGWTLRTHNRAVAVHHEHTIVVRRGEPLVVTRAA